MIALFSKFFLISTMPELKTARNFLKKSRHILIITGAGISKASGIQTFRDKGGLWEGQDPMKVATATALAKNRLFVWQFYLDRRKDGKKAKPNAGHLALADYEKNSQDKKILICTQNIDGLHTKAGSSKVVEIHGNLYRSRCEACGHDWTDQATTINELERCPLCQGQARPHIVLFEESYGTELNETINWIEKNKPEVCLTIGTSGVVPTPYHLAGLAKQSGAKLIEVNPEIPNTYVQPDRHLRGPAEEILPKLFGGGEKNSQDS